MRVDLKLSQQGLILAAVPLLFQLLFIGVLYHAMSGAESELKQASRAKEIIARTDLLPKLMKADNIFYFYCQTEDPSLLSQYKEVMGAVNEDLKILEELVKNDSRQSKQAERIATTTQRMTTVIEDGRKALDSKDRMAVSRYITRLRAMGTKLSWQVEELIKPYRKIQDVDQGKFRERLKQYLLYAVLANILIAIGLALAFNKSTIQRLNVLMDNTLRFAKGKPLLPLLTGRDELAQLDKFFHGMAESVVAAQRMKQEFLAMITHDIRTPLASMQGALNLVSLGVYKDQLSARTSSTLESIDDEFKRLIMLINDLLDIEQLESGRLEMHFDLVPVAYVLDKSAQAVRGISDQKQIVIEVPECEIEIFADGDRLVQVLINLLANAIKFSPEQGKISISVVDSQDWLEIRVADQGPGIPAGYHERIFDRFQQVRASDRKKHKGAGLGLAICRDIVEAHQGTIGVDSTEGQGSTFWFRIPMTEEVMKAQADLKPALPE